MFRKKTKKSWTSEANNYEVHFTVNKRPHTVILYSINKQSALDKFLLLYAGSYDGKINITKIKKFEG